jgi:O-antigen/teichoic acid export membrane protein
MKAQPDGVDLSMERLIRRRLLRGGGWALGGRMATALVGLASNALLARVLAPDDLGLFFIAFSIAGFGAIVGQLGLHQLAVRFVADSLGRGAPNRARRIALRIMLWGACGGFGVSALYLVFGRAIANSLFESARLADVTLIISGWIAVQTIQKLLAEVFRGFHDIRLATLFGGLATLGILALALAAVMLFDWDATLADAVWIAAAASLTAVVVAGFLFLRKLAAVAAVDHDRSHLPMLKTAALPIFITSILNFAVLQGDIWIVGALRTPDEVALYGAAAKLVVLVVIPLTMINAVVPPIIADSVGRGELSVLERTLRATATIAGIPAVLAIIVFALWGPSVLQILYGSYYSRAYGLLVILALGQLFNVFAGSCQLALMMSGNEGWALAAALTAGAITVIGGVGAVSVWGVHGMAWAVTTGLVAQNLFSIGAVRYRLGIWTQADPRVLRKVWS